MNFGMRTASLKRPEKWPKASKGSAASSISSRHAHRGRAARPLPARRSPGGPDPGAAAGPAFVFRPGADKGAQRHLVATAGRGVHSFASRARGRSRAPGEDHRPARGGRANPRSAAALARRRRATPRAAPSSTPGRRGTARSLCFTRDPRGPHGNPPARTAADPVLEPRTQDPSPESRLRT